MVRAHAALLRSLSAPARPPPLFLASRASIELVKVLGLDLWLVFGVLAFWLNFVPNVGAVAAVFLPMPLVVLDPHMPVANMVLAFVLPLCAHSLVGSVLEPLLSAESCALAQ